MTDGQSEREARKSVDRPDFLRRILLGIPACWGRREWTLEEDAILGTLSDKEVCRRLDLSARTVKERREKLGIPVRANPQKYQDARLRELLEKHGKLEPIALELGLSKQRVQQLYKRLWLSTSRGALAPPQGSE